MPKKQPSRALDLAMSSQWAIQQDALENIIEIGSRKNEVSPEMLQSMRSDSVGNTNRLQKRGSVGIIEAKGPLFKRANLFTAFSGATSYDMMMEDLASSASDDTIKQLALYIDSPGGEVSGCDEFMVALKNYPKKITAFISGTGASAAYMIASCADSIVVSEAAILGSIGVIMTTGKANDDQVQFVSSQSPNKRPDIETDTGKAEVQSLVDDLAAVFIAKVAENRGVTADQVVENFGAGGVKVGEDAVKAGMADSVGQFESLLTKLNSGKTSRRKTQGKATMADQTETAGEITAEDKAKIVGETASAEKTRMKAITRSDAAASMPATANHIAYDTEMSAADAEKLMAEVSKDISAASEAGKAEAAASTEQPKGKEPEGGEKADATLTAEQFAEKKSGGLNMGLPDTGTEKSGSAWGKTTAKLKA